MEQGHTILVVDDDPKIRRLIQRILEQEGYRIRTASNGQEMRQQVAEVKVDLILLDIRLPDEDGFTLVKELNSVPDLAVIMVTGKADPLDKVLGLELGADDYVTKPFHDRELLARVRSVLRRAHQENPLPQVRPDRTVACFAGWRLNTPAQELVSAQGDQVFLTTREYQLLVALVEHSQRVLSRDSILESLSGRDWTPIDRSVDVLVAKLRRKLGDDANRPQIIKTIRGTGYKLCCPVEFR